MILVHKSDPHDWQGDVISDLKKQSDMWQGDLTSEPKREPDFRRKADRERHLTEQKLAQNTTAKQVTNVPNCETGLRETSQNNDAHFSRENSFTEISQGSYSDVSQENLNRNNHIHGASNNLHQITQDDYNQSRPVSMDHSSEEMNSEQKKNEIWQGEGYVDTHRSTEVWQQGQSTSDGGRQPEQMRIEELMELKRSTDYWPTGIPLDASRHGEYFHGDNIPDPRKQIEFWQGQTLPEHKQENDQMQGQLTTLHNLSYSSQS